MEITLGTVRGPQLNPDPDHCPQLIQLMNLAYRVAKDSRRIFLNPAAGLGSWLLSSICSYVSGSASCPLFLALTPSFLPLAPCSWFPFLAPAILHLIVWLQSLAPHSFLSASVHSMGLVIRLLIQSLATRPVHLCFNQ